MGSISSLSQLVWD
uniref:Uncharacterized protein n=1 Tax=Arundo donax TaxID=35708 RepID=A0A0A9B949_ARUDO